MRILITAGPTWVPIDKVRVISNIATGKTGILLAKNANKSFKTSPTLVIGPVGEVKLDKAIKVRRFSYFDELDKVINEELKTKKFDVVIHSAAVSDYKLKKEDKGKISSNLNKLNLELESTVKLIDKIKKIDPKVFLVMFKLELNGSLSQMVSKARISMKKAKADLCVVNTFSDSMLYTALIIDKEKVLHKVNSKEKLVDKLLKVIFNKSN